MLSIRAFAVVLALGCLGTFVQAQPTYSREVSRIIQQKCQMCHRPGDIAPFALMNYDDARVQARAIRGAVDSRIMPPWKPIPGHGEFQHDLSLSDEDRQTILDWVDAGSPEGDPADLPPPVVYAEEWRLGPPDQIVSMPLPYVPIPREDRPDRYRCFVLPNVTDQDRWVRAVDIVPGQRQLVHHVLLYLTDDPDQIKLLKQFEDEDAEPGYDCWGGPRITPGAGPGLLKAAGGLLGAWVPGMAVSELPPSIGLLVPKGAYAIMQIHYHLDDGPATVADMTRLGLYFQKDPPKNRLLTLPLLNDQFVLKPGVEGQQVNMEFPLDLGAFGLPLPDAFVPKFSAIAVGPHMHQLGRKIRADLVQPDSTQVPLIEIDDWDFHWQGLYQFKDPVPLPYRSRITASCVFDNTTDHEVRWGESTNDEMCLVYIGFIAEGGLSWLLFGNPS